MDSSEIRTQRLLLRPLSFTDLDGVEQLHADPRVMATLGGPRSALETRDFLRKQVDHWHEHRFGLWSLHHVESGAFVGRAGLRRVVVLDHPEVEVTYALLPDYWGMGLATEVARQSVGVAFADLALQEVVCFALEANRSSRRVMDKVGFRFESAFDRDGLPHVLYRLSKVDWSPGCAA